MNLLKKRIQQLIALVERWPVLVALFGFASGVASFVLVEREESLATAIALLMLVSWVWLVLENWMHTGLLQRFGIDVPPGLTRYASQMVHQESLFFALPFFFAVTTWDHGQALFTALLILCALISLVDPIYYKQLAPRRSLFVVFHALALFAVLLVSLPLILHLTTGKTLALALGIALLFSLPGLRHTLHGIRWWRLPLLALLLAGLAAGLWQMRGWIPPATLRLTDIALSQEVDRHLRLPGESLHRIAAPALKREGLYAWTAIRAPRGLREQIHHVWIFEGETVDRITLELEGGRKAGYRSWTHKLVFPENPVGNWQLRVVTDSGQLIGHARFTVTAGQPEGGGLGAGTGL